MNKAVLVAAVAAGILMLGACDPDTEGGGGIEIDIDHPRTTKTIKPKAPKVITPKAPKRK